MDTNPLLAFIERLRSTEPVFEAPEEPEHLAGLERRLSVVSAEDMARHPMRPTVPLAQARDLIARSLRDYAALDDPQHALLVKAMPGTGKTTAAVRFAEELAAQGARVLYAGPRHDFYADIQAVAAHPAWWYEWLPRQYGDEQAGKPQTCRHAEEIQTWLWRGYRGIDFCAAVCGWDYVNDYCPYHAQKRRTEPIIFGQHQHVFLGHPLADSFDMVIGDESPLGAVAKQWVIPAAWILPDDLSPRFELYQTLVALTSLCAQPGLHLEGPSLIQALGGAEHVLSVIDEFSLPATAVIIPPDIHYAADAERVAFNHLRDFLPLLYREARACLEGREWPHRIVAGDGALMLLMREYVDDQMPRHVVWLDATANEHLYEATLSRPVEVVDAAVDLRGQVFQVHDRANGKAAVVGDNGASARGRQMIEFIQHVVADRGYERFAVVTFQQLLDELGGAQTLHFYAARGSNALEGVQALFVAGTPQPALVEMDKLARMIYFGRDTPFNATWSTRLQVFNFLDEEGRGRAYPTSGFWSDPDLQAVLWQMREAEIIQAAHRARPILHDVDIWLLLNLALEELPPSRLLDMRAALGAPPGTDIFLWSRAMQIAEELDAIQGYVTSVDLVAALGLDSRTARKYIDLLIEDYGWQEVRAATRSRGRPPRAAHGCGQGQA